MSSLGEMLAGVAHEINNPVTFILGNLNHIDDYTKDLLNLAHILHRNSSNLQKLNWIILRKTYPSY
ncbi:histidine kinase dimerization/phospho-acceptor domain-containing protein [Okeania hirsuta]|uniref:histidine kinase dimerization/phospho-acceptor domain-containing protein n=1 Tax=Okeania hirsuta TaxID=1458930 RepID=UPI000F527008|nr:histidine kinase dimerization/phospho-acceptor domain-containing protein [Okeania hirsuta]